MNDRFTCNWIYILMLVTALGCSQKKGQKSMPSEAAVQHDQKEKVKSFWETYRKAQQLRVAGEWQQAAQYYEQSLMLDSTHENARFNLGNIYLELGKFNAAESCWQQILRDNPQSAKSYMQLGRLYLNYDQPDFFNLQKATDMFSGALAINRVITEPQLYLGKIDLLKNNPANAERYFKAVLITDEKNIEASFLLGYLSWKKGHILEAKQFFDRAATDAKSKVKPKKELVEGDTKGGVSHLRSTHTSLFGEMFEDLGTLSSTDDNLVNSRYSQVQRQIELVRSKYRL